MEELLQDLVGTVVELRSNAAGAEHTDRGTLEAVNDRWCRMRAADGSVLCFPIANVRLVKGRTQRPSLPVPASAGDIADPAPPSTP
jgi:hypothetical protein